MIVLTWLRQTFCTRDDDVAQNKVRASPNQPKPLFLPQKWLIVHPEVVEALDTFAIDKEYAEKLRSKISTFKTVTKTRKAVFLTMNTTYGVEKNKYATQLVQNEVTMDDLFV